MIDNRETGFKESVIEDVLNEKGFVVAHPKGWSMRPFLRADDTIVLVKTRGEDVKVWDCVLFTRTDGVKVLHRAIKISADKILTRGDYEKNFDAPVPKENVLAVMTEYYRGKKHVSVSDPSYIKKTKRWNGRGRKIRLFFYRSFIKIAYYVDLVFLRLFKRSAK